MNTARAGGETSAPAGRFRLADVGATLVLAFIAWHVFASFLWIAPPSPLRQLVPEETLRGYMIPWFGQSWSVFAPDPINGDHEILVRARLDTGETTGWVNATDVEYALAHHNPFPPKASAMGMHQASEFLEQWNALSSSERAVVRESRGSSPDADRVALANGVPQAYVDEERRTSTYATLVSRTAWGDGVTEVQFLVQRRGIVPFSDRNDTSAQRPAPVTAEPGWRKPATVSADEVERFSATFRQGMDAAGVTT